VKFNAVEAIARLGDERIDEKLLAMLISTYADDRVVGVKAMGALGTEKAKNFLITKLDDDVLEVRLAAAEQLGMLGETTGEVEVLKVFTKNLTTGMDKEELERVDTLTALAIGQIGTANLTKFLPQLLKNESKFVRIATAKAVFQCAMRNQAAKNPPITFRR
jgi:HEAT repeat protein